MNNVNLIGNIGQDPEIKYLETKADEKPFCTCSFSLAVPRYSKKEGKEIANWIKCKALGKTDENIGEFFKKGSRIGITGEIITNTWKNEQDENRSMTYVQVSRFDFLTKKDSSESPSEQQKYSEEELTPDELIGEDEIPF